MLDQSINQSWGAEVDGSFDRLAGDVVEEEDGIPFDRIMNLAVVGAGPMGEGRGAAGQQRKGGIAPAMPIDLRAIGLDVRI